MARLSAFIFLMLAYVMMTLANPQLQAITKRVGALEAKNKLGWASTSSPVYINGDYILAFRVTPGVGKSAYDAYMKEGHDDDNFISTLTMPCGCTSVDGAMPCDRHYRGAVLNYWDNNVDRVRLSLYENGVEKAYAEFDGKGSTFTSWFTKDRLLESSWADLKTSPHRFFSIAGHESGGLVRRFFLEKNYGGCPNDNGWLVVLEKNDTCSWGKTDSVPKILYANSQSNVNWDKGQVGVADVMTISVKLLQPAVCPFGK